MRKTFKTFFLKTHLHPCNTKTFAALFKLYSKALVRKTLKHMICLRQPDSLRGVVVETPAQKSVDSGFQSQLTVR